MVALAGPGSAKLTSSGSPTRAPHSRQGPQGQGTRESRTSPPSAAPALRPPAESGAGVGRFRPGSLSRARLWAAGSCPRRRPSSRGGFAVRVPFLPATGCSPRPARAEGGGEGGERGGRKARERALLGSRTSQSLPGARIQRLCRSPCPSRAPRPAAPPPPLRAPLAPSLQQLLGSGCGRPQPLPGPIPNSLGSLLGRASLPHPFFLPSSPPPCPGLAPGSRLSPSPAQPARASPRPAGSRALPESPGARSRDAAAPAAAAAPGEGNSGRARPRPAPRPALPGEGGPGR